MFNEVLWFRKGERFRSVALCHNVIRYTAMLRQRSKYLGPEGTRFTMT
jgi:hypothetical protein